jgi:hypothetical protein
MSPTNREARAAVREAEFAAGLIRTIRLPRFAQSGEFGAARFATDADLVGPASGKPIFPSSVLMLATDGVARETQLRPFRPRDGLRLSEELLRRHLLAVGATGSGKTQRVILPALTHAVSSGLGTATVDFHGELWRNVVVANRRRPLPGPTAIFDFERPEQGPGLNLLAALPNDASAGTLASLVDVASQGQHFRNEDRFFGRLREARTADLFTVARRERLGFNEIARIVADPEALKRAGGRHPDLPGLGALAVGVASGSHNMLTVQNDVLSFLEGLRPTGTLLERSGPPLLDVLRQNGHVVFVCPEHLLDAHRVPLCLAVAATFEGLLQLGTPDDERAGYRGVRVVLDEFSLLSLPAFERRINTLRKRRVSVVAAVQSVDQLATAYGSRAPDVLAGFSSKIFFGEGLARADAERAAFESGAATALAWEPNPLAFLDPRAPQEFERRFARPTLLPGDVSAPCLHATLGSAATVVLPGTPVFQAWLPPFFRTAHGRRILKEAAAISAKPAPPVAVPAARPTAESAAVKPCPPELRVNELVKFLAAATDRPDRIRRLLGWLDVESERDERVTMLLDGAYVLATACLTFVHPDEIPARLDAALAARRRMRRGHPS